MGMRTKESLRKWAQALIDEGNSLGEDLMEYAEAWEADVSRQEPVAKVRVHKTGGNAGIAWSAAPINDYDRLPPLPDGALLYVKTEGVHRD